MTRKELNLAIFEGKTDKVLWQPRLETWYWHHKAHGSLPDRFKDLEYFAFYDALRCSTRYAASAGLDSSYEPDDVLTFAEDPNEHTHVEGIRTPDGELRTVYQIVPAAEFGENRRIVEFPVKTAQDLKVLTGLVERTQYKANPKAFADAADAMGQRGEPTLFINSSGFTDLVKWWAGLVDTFYLLADCPAELEAYLEACDRRDDRQLDAAFQLPCRLFNLGDHATNEFTPPPILKKYLLPRWQRISRRMAERQCYVHSHWDGHSRQILPFLQESGLQAVEALTPEPMGDMSLEMIKGAVKDNIVVLDLIPAILFLPSYSTQEVLDFTKRVIDLFAPKLILGVSDEISQVGQIEKIEAVGQLVDSVCGLAE